MDKDELQSTVLNLVALTYLNQTKVSQIEQFLLRLADKIDPGLVQTYRIEQQNACNRVIAISHLNFFDDLDAENQIVLGRIKELALDIFS